MIFGNAKRCSTKRLNFMVKWVSLPYGLKSVNQENFWVVLTQYEMAYKFNNTIFQSTKYPY